MYVLQRCLVTSDLSYKAYRLKRKAEAAGRWTLFFRHECLSSLGGIAALVDPYQCYRRYNSEMESSNLQKSIILTLLQIFLL